MTRQQHSDAKNKKYIDDTNYMIYYIHQEKDVYEIGSPATQQTHPKEEVCHGGEGLSIMLVAPITYKIIKHSQGPPTERPSPLGMPLGQEERLGWYGSHYLLLAIEMNYVYHDKQPLTMGHTPWYTRAHGRGLCYQQQHSS